MLRRNAAISIVSSLTLLSATAGLSRAGDLFSVVATGNTSTVTAGGSSLLNLSQNVVNNQSQFAALQNQTFTATLNYAGIQRAVTFTQSFDTNNQRVIRLQVPLAGVDKTFSQANGSIGTQVRNFLKTEGLADLGTFQAKVNQESLAGVVDGNPLSDTAQIADLGYQQFALHPTPFRTDGQPFSVDAGHVEARYWVQGGVLNADGASGQYANLYTSTEIHFNDRIGIALAGAAGYRHIHNASIYTGAMLLGLPITILPGNGDNSVSWLVTPAGHAGVVGSPDFVSGGLIYGGQIDSSLSYTVGGFTFTLADQAGYYKGAGLNVAGYNFQTNLDQFVLKNGVQLTKAWGDFFVDGSATWTNFVHNAFVDGYLTPSAGFGFRFGKDRASGVRVGYTGDFGNHYQTNGGTVMLFFTY